VTQHRENEAAPTESVRAQAIVITGARSIATVLGVAAPLIVVRLLDQGQFGEYKQLILISSTAAGAANLGIPGSLFYLVPREPRRAAAFLTQSLLQLTVLGILIGLGLLACSQLLREHFAFPGASSIILMASLTALSMPGALLPIAPLVDRRARLAGGLLVLSELIRSVSVVAGAFIVRDARGPIIGGTIAMLVQTLCALAYIAWRQRGQPRPTRSTLISQLRYSLPFAGTSLIGLTRDQLHAFFIAAQFSAAQFALYAVGTTPVPLIGHVNQTLGELVVLEAAAHHGAGRIEALQAVWFRAQSALLLIVIGIFMSLEIFARDMMMVLYGANFVDAAPVFRVFILGLPISAALMTSPLLRATGDLKVMLKADVASCLAALLALWPMVRVFGPPGAVGSMLVGVVTFALFTAPKAARLLQLRLRNLIRWKLAASLLGIGVLAAITAYAVTAALPSLPRLLLGCSLSMLLYAGMAWYLHLVPAPERAWMVGWVQSQWNHLRRARALGPWPTHREDGAAGPDAGTTLHDASVAQTPGRTGVRRSPQRILFMHQGDDWIRGSERCLLDLMAGLPRDRFEPVLWCDAPTLADAARLVEVDVELYEPGGLSCAKVLPDGPLLRRVARHIRDSRARLVHANTGSCVHVAAPICLREGIPLVAHIHISPTFDERHWLLVHQATRIVGCSEVSIEGFRDDGLSQRRIRVIHNGVSETRLDDGPPWAREQVGIRDDDIVFVALGSLIPRKGVDSVVRAFAQMDSAIAARCRLLLVGEGPERIALEALANELGVSKSMVFLGEQSAVGPILRGLSDVYISASHMEAFPLSVLEAAWSRLPLILSDIRPHREMFGNSAAACIVDTNDAKALAQAMEVCARDGALRERMSATGRARVAEGFLVRHYLEQFRALYDELLGSPSTIFTRLPTVTPSYAAWIASRLARPAIRHATR
jgi:glycosyltransferase involved in cell wall biosynthesis/O-antigen/teichoic acid export membrane protein